MAKRQGLVVSVDVPKCAHVPGTFEVKLAYPIRTGYANDDEGNTFQFQRRVAKTGKKSVFLDYRPTIGSWIAVPSWASMGVL